MTSREPYLKDVRRVYRLCRGLVKGFLKVCQFLLLSNRRVLALPIHCRLKLLKRKHQLGFGHLARLRPKSLVCLRCPVVLIRFEFGAVLVEGNGVSEGLDRAVG